MATFRVFILEYGMNRLSDGLRDAARKEVADELNKVAAESKKPAVKAGFEVSWGKSGTAPSSKDLKPTDFVVYLLSKRDASTTLELIKKHVTVSKSQEKDILEKVAAPLKVEGGANIKLGDSNVSFVAVNAYDDMLRGPTLDDDETERTESYAGEKLGELILHELGHGMDANHDHGIMEAHPDLSVNPDAPSAVQHFTKTSKTKILKTLERLAGTAK